MSITKEINRLIKERENKSPLQIEEEKRRKSEKDDGFEHQTKRSERKVKGDILNNCSNLLVKTKSEDYLNYINENYLGGKGKIGKVCKYLFHSYETKENGTTKYEYNIAPIATVGIEWEGKSKTEGIQIGASYDSKGYYHMQVFPGRNFNHEYCIGSDIDKNIGNLVNYKGERVNPFEFRYGPRRIVGTLPEKDIARNMVRAIGAVTSEHILNNRLP